MVRRFFGVCAGVVLIAVVAACSSSGSSSSSAAKAATKSGTENMYGKITGNAMKTNAPTIPLTFSGPVVATGKISLGGPAPKKGQTHTFATSKGNLVALVTANPAVQAAWVNKKTCFAKELTTVKYTVDGAKSTGSFKDATGHGVVVVTFESNSELKGKCSLANNAQPTTMKNAFATFTGTGPLTIKA